MSPMPANPSKSAVEMKPHCYSESDSDTSSDALSTLSESVGNWADQVDKEEAEEEAQAQAEAEKRAFTGHLGDHHIQLPEPNSQPGHQYGDHVPQRQPCPGGVHSQQCPTCSYLGSVSMPAGASMVRIDPRITPPNNSQPPVDRRKTRMCKHWQADEPCPTQLRGQACIFAHGVHELRAASKKQVSDTMKYKTAWCKSVGSNVPCRYGELCQYAHNYAELRSPQY